MPPKITALRDVVLFQFLDITEGTRGRFTDRVLGSGILIAPTQSRQKIHRWGKVYAVGPKAADDLKVGDFILIQSMQWMEGVKLDKDTKVWKTDPAQILMVTDDINETWHQ